MINKCFVFFFMIIFILSSVLVVSAETVSVNVDGLGVKNSLTSAPFVDLLDGSTFRITKTYTNGDIVSETNAARPYVEYESDLASVSFKWNVAYANYKNLNFFLSASGTASCNLDGNSIRLTAAGNTGRIITRNYSYATYFSVIEITFTNPTNHCAIFGLYANINNVLSLSDLSWQAWNSISTFDDGVITEMIVTDDVVHTTEAESGQILAYSTTSTNEDLYLNWGRLRLTVNSTDYEGLFVDKLSFNIFTSGYEVPNLTAFISTTPTQGEDTIYPGYQAVNVSAVPFGSVPGDALNIGIDEFTYNCYTVNIDLSGVELYQKYLIIDITTEPFIFETWKRHTMIGACYPFYYSIPVMNTSISSSVLSCLEKILVSTGNYDEALSLINSALDSILTVLSDSDLSDKLDDILIAINDNHDDLTAILTRIEEWLYELDLPPDDPIFDDFEKLENDRNTVQDLIDEIDSVPKTDVEDFQGQVEKVDDAIQLYMPEESNDDDPTFIAPFTVGDFLTDLYVPTNGVSSLIVTFLVTASAIALIGYVLFGKR